MRFLSTLFLIVAIIIRIIVLQKNFYRSIVSWTLVSFLFVNITEALYSQIIFPLELGNKAFWSLVLISVCSVLSLFFYSVTDNGYLSKSVYNVKISKKYFSFIFLFYLGSLTVFIKNFLAMGLTYNFQMNLLNGNSDEIISGLFGYLFMLGIASVLFIPYVDIPNKVKVILLGIVVVAYSMYPRRLYLFITCMILLIEYGSKVKIKKRYVASFFGLFIVLFHVTQLILNKSVYYQLIVKYKPAGAHLRAIVLDPLIYFVGNITNIDYIASLPVGNTRLLLNNTLYPLYSLLNILGFENVPKLTNVFVSVGNYSTNTVSYIAYYIQEGGIMYAGVMTLLIFLMLEFISKQNTLFSKIIYPFFLSSGILLFRENDYLLIYFYVTVVVILIGSLLVQQDEENT